MSNWENRQVYQEITKDTIKKIPDDLLVWAMFDYIWLKVGKNVSAQAKTGAGKGVAKNIKVRET